ncbi:hypothetical protein AB3N59_18190 [Leptospira sp. WS92.C1]
MSGALSAAEEDTFAKSDILTHQVEVDRVLLTPIAKTIDLDSEDWLVSNSQMVNKKVSQSIRKKNQPQKPENLILVLKDSRKNSNYILSFSIVDSISKEKFSSVEKLLLSQIRSQFQNSIRGLGILTSFVFENGAEQNCIWGFLNFAVSSSSFCSKNPSWAISFKSVTDPAEEKMFHVWEHAFSKKLFLSLDSFFGKRGDSYGLFKKGKQIAPELGQRRHAWQITLSSGAFSANFQKVGNGASVSRSRSTKASLEFKFASPEIDLMSSEFRKTSSTIHKAYCARTSVDGSHFKSYVFSSDQYFSS